MDIRKMLAQLRFELANLDAAIESLERLQGGSRGPGRPRSTGRTSTVPPDAREAESTGGNPVVHKPKRETAE